MENSLCVLQKSNGSILIHFQVNCTALNSIQGRIKSKINTKLYFEVLYLSDLENEMKKNPHLSFTHYWYYPTAVWSHSLEFDLKFYLPKQCKFFSENWYMYSIPCLQAFLSKWLKKSLIGTWDILKILVFTQVITCIWSSSIFWLTKTYLPTEVSQNTQLTCDYQYFYEGKSALLWDMKMLWCRYLIAFLLCMWLVWL